MMHAGSHAVVQALSSMGCSQKLSQAACLPYSIGDACWKPCCGYKLGQRCSHLGVHVWHIWDIAKGKY